MFSRSRIALVFALLASLIFTLPAFAGGWAVITLDELPADVVAGEPLTVGFTVLQHGITPMEDLSPTVTVSLLNGSQFVVYAEPDGKPGHYTATLTFPKEGDWNWSIQAFTMDQLMPMLTVAAPVGGVVKQPVVESEPIPASTAPLTILRLSVLGVGIAGLVFAFRKKSRMAMALSILCLLVGVASFVTVPAVPAAEAQGKPSVETANEASLSQEELGARLFIAKGCITCHVNAKVSNYSDYWTISPEGATNLTNFSASPEVLYIRLKDPTAAKSDTKMPNLGLTKVEIEALIAFINSK